MIANVTTRALEVVRLQKQTRFEQPEKMTINAAARGSSRHPERTTQLYEGGCKQNEPESCLWLGILFRSGHGVPVDAKRGTAAIQRSCQLGNQEGCGELGVSYLDGLGVAPDADKGLALLRHSCLAQVGTSCLQLGFAYETGRHVVQNPMLARELYKKGCNAKPSSAESCTRLANLKASAPQKPVVRAPASVTARPW